LARGTSAYPGLDGHPSYNPNGVAQRYGHQALAPPLGNPFGVVMCRWAFPGSARFARQPWALLGNPVGVHPENASWRGSVAAKPPPTYRPPICRAPRSQVIWCLSPFAPATVISSPGATLLPAATFIKNYQLARSTGDLSRRSAPALSGLSAAKAAAPPPAVK
jgi:hypothetical protein